ncbi:hypothetical protein M405DRAFT_756964 [Rhizopogon salebrosus TDB-379]|nr:hypothetical protein M405DRAFT_756964 [Rhizopogon salebrosus TDB-379]
MVPETNTQPSRPSKPTTRSSIRQSLNFTSVGKALADVINKESRDREKSSDKALKKSKDSSRRLSAIALMNSSAIPYANATATSKSKSPTPGHRDSKEDSSPSTKTITRSTRRQSGLLRPAAASSSDEMGLKLLDAGGVSPTIKRASTLRPRTAPAPTSSALPKYRPKSTLIESVLPKKTVSPPRTGTRRRLSTSEEEEKAHNHSPGRNSVEKSKRPISPLPHRALAVKVNLPKLTPPSTPSKINKLSPPKKASPAKVDSTRPAKSAKTTTTSSASRSNIARPPSSSSSSRSSICSQSSPQTPSKSTFGFGRSKPNQPPSPQRSTGRPAPESPLAHHSRQHSTTTLARNVTPTQLSQLTEDDSEDSIEVDDVELLLAPAAPLGAPTPAIPRIRAVRHQRDESELQTPSRPSQFLPTRDNLSYLSPLPPTSQSSPRLRPPKANGGVNRGSIMSWEQLAHDGSQIIGQEEVEKMLSEIQAPFTPGGPSPNVSTLEVPESPCLSALPSPGGYGSISHVLLPDVTPSPAIHHINQMFDTSAELPPPMDSGTVTLLRLQVASAENMAKERLTRLLELEELLHTATQSRIQETEELAKQVSFLEKQLHISVGARERVDEERAAFTASLQDRLRHAEARGEQAVEAAFARGQEKATASLASVLKHNQNQWEVCSLASEIKGEWASVKEQAKVEQDFLRASRETLKVFLAVLDHSQMQMHGLLA